jgi:TIR domain
MPHVFISYVREDAEIIIRLSKELEKNGLEVWLDRGKILPGVRWQQAIRSAIREGSFFIACFSASYSKRNKSYMNEELTLAIEELRQRQTKSVWFIPVVLSECDIPDRDIGAGETLQSIQHVRLYEDWETGIRDIVSVIRLNSTEFIHKLSGRGIRLSLEVPPHQLERLDNLVRQTGISTRKDFFNQALALLEWAVKEKLAGRVIGSIDEKAQMYREVIMPVLSISKRAEEHEAGSE